VASSTLLEGIIRTCASEIQSVYDDNEDGIY